MAVNGGRHGLISSGLSGALLRLVLGRGTLCTAVVCVSVFVCMTISLYLVYMELYAWVCNI